MQNTADDVKRIALQAGVDLHDYRAAAVASSASMLAAAARMLAAIDFGDTEPAASVRLPPPKDR